MLARRTLGLVAAALLASAASATLCGCSKDTALRITNVYENGDTDFHYDYCENLGDGRGFTAGIAGFCTGTSDAWEVIQEYHKLTGGNDAFSPMDAVLAKYSDSGSDSTSGLTDYCAVWEKLGKTDVKFQHAQDTVRDALYFTPSQAAADKLGLKFDISRGQLYDTGIEHGTGSDADGLLALVDGASKTFTADQTGDSGSTLNINGHKVDEIAWLKAFIAVREADLTNPKEKDNQGGNYWAQTTYRTKSYTYAIGLKEYMYGSSIKILDNDGKPMTVKCGISTGGGSSNTTTSDSSNSRRRRRDARGVPIKRYRTLVPPSGPPTKRRLRPALQNNDVSAARHHLDDILG
ncbi:hypothetical protein H4R18_005755 [Coemansia javaensis]|uniref:Chitosanase n=1 Tax=Coemansia javaensis TaxID=2761396 RepID=A0A9W8LDT0_9FUNG|nr:hypothetical protein H4R18_005755 [Coemansia javaensis]